MPEGMGGWLEDCQALEAVAFGLGVSVSSARKGQRLMSRGTQSHDALGLQAGAWEPSTGICLPSQCHSVSEATYLVRV